MAGWAADAAVIAAISSGLDILDRPGMSSSADLLARAADLDIPGRSKMSKPELIEAISAASGAQPRKRRSRKIS